MSKDDCQRCEGCGQIADSEEGEPWSDWMALPVSAAFAVVSGLVKPVPCPSCRGSGKQAEPVQ